MTEAGLDIKDPKNCNRFPPLGGIRWHRVVLDVRAPPASPQAECPSSKSLAIQECRMIKDIPSADQGLPLFLIPDP